MNNAKNVGIIAEYNPLHNGHAYQIQYLRQKCTAETITVIMSGDFVQRGAPAWTDKYLRTRMALSQGVDFVFELPVRFSLSSAEGFAQASVQALTDSGLIDSLCFGCESSSLAPLQTAANFLAQTKTSSKDCLAQYKAFDETVKTLCKQGFSYPFARQRALQIHCSDLNITDDSILSAPNNILAIEYLTWIQKHNLPLTPIPVTRTDRGYHSKDFSGSLASATAIRNLCQTTELLSKCKSALPEAVYLLLQSRPHYPIQSDDFSTLLYYRLRQCSCEDLCVYLDITPALARRIQNQLPQFQTVSQFIAALKTKNITYSRISRCLFHVLLSLSSKKPTNPLHPVPYLRLLGMQRKKSYLLRKTTSLPIITKVADAKKTLENFYLESDEAFPQAYPYAWSCFQEDLFAADIYRQVANSKLQCQIPDEYRAGPIIL